MMIVSKGEKAFYIINEIFLVCLVAVMMYPIIYVISASFSSADAIRAGKVILFPKEVNLEAYKYILNNKNIWMAYANAIFYTVVGTLICMVVTICGAYPLSKTKLPGKTVILFAVAVTMWFGGGMIPTYLNFRDLGLVNSRTGYLIGFACSAYNFILLRNFFMSIPRGLEEAAHVDGANEMTILTKIYIPLSFSALATIALFYAVAKWNTYLWPMILFTDDSKIPLQVLIKKMIVDLQVDEIKAASVDQGLQQLSAETAIYSSIVVSTIPMLILYPFVQKYFVKGVMVGAIKG